MLGIAQTPVMSNIAGVAFRSELGMFGNSPPTYKDWWQQPSAFTGNPIVGPAIADISSGKNRVSQFAGMPDRIVSGDTSRFGGNLQWGTTSVLDPNYVGSTIDTVYTDSPTNVETSASVWLKHKNNTDGSQEYAMGRVKKTNNGILRFQQNADDALVGSCPRVQWFTSALINLQGVYRIYLSAQFGDATTPFPAYVLNQDSILFMQLKGAASQPIISATVSYDAPASETLQVGFNMKRTNAGGITNLGTVTGLAKATRHDFMLECILDYGAGGYWALWHNGVRIATLSGNTLMSDLADSVQMMLGIYRYQYAAKAPDASAILFHLAGIANVDRILP